jgi:hypothetical protein
MIACVSDRCSNRVELSSVLVGRGGICTTTVFRRRFYRASGSLVPSRPMMSRTKNKEQRTKEPQEPRIADGGSRMAWHLPPAHPGGDGGLALQVWYHLFTRSPLHPFTLSKLVPLAGAAPTLSVWKTPALLLRHSGIMTMNFVHPSSWRRRRARPTGLEVTRSPVHLVRYWSRW